MVRYFEPENPEDLAGGVKKVPQDSRLRGRQLKRARSFLDKHNWQVYKETYHKILEI
jgi:hypothetical protein